MTTLKALTIRQPWASLIMAGIKDVENRSWRTSYRGRLAIHAGKGFDRSEWADLFNVLPSGLILGTVELIECVLDADSEWAEADSWHWLLSDPEPYTHPRLATGKLGLWIAAA